MPYWLGRKGTATRPRRHRAIAYSPGNWTPLYGLEGSGPPFSRWRRGLIGVFFPDPISQDGIEGPPPRALRTHAPQCGPRTRRSPHSLQVACLLEEAGLFPFLNRPVVAVRGFFPDSAVLLQTCPTGPAWALTANPLTKTIECVLGAVAAVVELAAGELGAGDGRHDHAKIERTSDVGPSAAASRTFLDRSRNAEWLVR